MKYVIWGAGKRGRHVLNQIGEKNVIAFVDTDFEKQGATYLGIPVISLEEYVEKYQDYFIVISYLHEEVGIKILEKYDISQYLLLSECPGEFQENYERKILQNYIKNLIKENKKYGIIGKSLYSFLVYEWVWERCQANPYYIIEKRLDKKVEKILEMNGYILVEPSSMILEKCDEIFLCQYMPNKRTIKDRRRYIYDCSGEIEEYYNPLIETYRNIHSNERCFIVATGPSLRKTDLDILQKQNVVCISMNDIWRIFPETSWRPSYYVADDYDAFYDIPREILESNNFVKFLGDTSKEFWEKEHSISVIKHHFNYEYSENRMPEFSEDFSRQCYMGSTVTYSCIQLAVYLGFKKIYLLGVDFSYAGKDNQKYAHFYTEDELVSVGFTRQVDLAYKSAKCYADSHDIEIYNATRGGKLEAFPRVDFDELFSKV